MKLLALDSATSAPSIALLRDGAIRLERLDGARGRDEQLVPEIAALLEREGIALASLDRLAVTIGPGRFTGLRAGLAAMRGLALASGLKLVGVTTLEAVAEAARGSLEPDESLLAAIDSRRAEPFLQVFAPDGSARGEPFAAPIERIAALAPAGRLALAGERTDEIARALAHAGRAARTLPLGCDAAAVATLGARAAPPDRAPSPFYLHPPSVTPARVRA